MAEGRILAEDLVDVLWKLVEGIEKLKENFSRPFMPKNM